MARFELSMHRARVIQSGKARVWVLLIALVILASVIAVVLSLCRGSPKSFEMDDLYGWLD